MDLLVLSSAGTYTASGAKISAPGPPSHHRMGGTASGRLTSPWGLLGLLQSRHAYGARGLALLSVGQGVPAGLLLVFTAIRPCSVHFM